LIKKVLCSISFKEAQNLAKKLVTFGSISEVRECYFNTISKWIERIEEFTGEKASLINGTRL